MRGHHGCCWETFYAFAYCGLVVEIPTQLLAFTCLLRFQRHPSHGVHAFSRAFQQGAKTQHTSALRTDEALIFQGVREKNI